MCACGRVQGSRIIRNPIIPQGRAGHRLTSCTKKIKIEECFFSLVHFTRWPFAGSYLCFTLYMQAGQTTRGSEAEKISTL